MYVIWQEFERFPWYYRVPHAPLSAKDDQKQQFFPFVTLHLANKIFCKSSRRRCWSRNCLVLWQTCVRTGFWHPHVFYHVSQGVFLKNLQNVHIHACDLQDENAEKLWTQFLKICDLRKSSNFGYFLVDHERTLWWSFALGSLGPVFLTVLCKLWDFFHQKFSMWNTTVPLFRDGVGKVNFLSALDHF